MNAVALPFPMAPDHRRRVGCYRGRRSKPWTPALRLALRVTFIAVLIATPVMLGVLFYVSRASGG